MAKGIRLLDELCSGDSKATRAPLAGLPAALELASEVIADASDKESNKSRNRLLRVTIEGLNGWGVPYGTAARY